MDRATARARTTLLLALAAALAVWAIVGFLQGRNAGYSDALYSPSYVIEYVPPGSPLDEAGFRAGDRVVSVEGTPVEELGMYSRWPRSLQRRPGESIRMVVDRDGEPVSGDVVYREIPRSVVNMRIGGLAIVLTFFGFGFWALLTVQSSHAYRLAYIGLAALAAIPGPNLGSWNGVVDHIGAAAVVLWSLLLLRFFLLFPTPKRAGESRLATGLIYGAWLAVILCLVLELIFHPTLYHTFGPFIALLALGYVILALAAATHTALKTPSQELRDSGMRTILIGFLVGIAASLLAFVDSALVTGFDVPGSGYLPLLIGAIPLTMALAVRKDAASGAPATRAS